ncbi:MAG: 4-hydroxyphenylpyruvate dioxygenase [Monoraphidium minutum]|nr:MAG: 4-hydroxyphenylpyruvate dioxygenase [Monoraphidium minutum]
MGAGAASEGAVRAPLQLVGFDNFKRHNPRSDRFTVHRFHHVEFWCGDATNTYKRFQQGLGMTLVAKSDQSTGNATFASYVLQSHELVFALTAPYSRKAPRGGDGGAPLPGYSQDAAYEFLNTHGLAVRAVGLLVDDAAEAYAQATTNGGVGVVPPTPLPDCAGGAGGCAVVSEVKLYGDVVLRFVSGDYKGAYLPGFTPTPEAPRLCYGLRRLDHAVGNTHDLLETASYIINMLGFHEFAEFVAKDIGTVDSGLNSMVLANNNEMVLLPVNEPTFGTKRKSQIQTYLEQNEGPGLQHLALKTNDIIATMREMRARSDSGGFEFMPRPCDSYYRALPGRIGDVLSAEQYAALEALGILADRDDKGVLLQIFTKPLGDRPTVFIEIIERVGCTKEVPAAGPPAAAEPEPAPAGGFTTAAAQAAAHGAADVIARRGDGVVVEQAAGCGGFGKGNFGALFLSIEEYERTLAID